MAKDFRHYRVLAEQLSKFVKRGEKGRHPGGDGLCQ